MATNRAQRKRRTRVNQSFPGQFRVLPVPPGAIHGTGFSFAASENAVSNVPVS
jgi:hypothetical protein